MINPKQPKKRKPLGSAIVWTDQDLAEMAQVTAADKKAAAALWENEAPQRLANLLSATVEEKQSDGTH